MRILEIALIFLVGTIGGLFAKKKKVPAGAMIGAMLAVAVWSVCSNMAHYPASFRPFVQALSGTVIGVGFTRADVAELFKIIKPAILLMALLILFTVLFGWSMTQLSDVDFMTALFSCAPGGVSDMALISEDFGAQPEQVTILQLVRFVFVLSFFPAYLKHRYLDKAPVTVQAEQPASSMQSEPQQAAPLAPELSGKEKLGRMSLTLICGVAGGYLFRWLGIPAGAIIGALIAVVLVNLVAERGYLPKNLRTAIQICSGCYIGSQITRQAVLSIRILLVPMLIVIVGVFVMSFVSAWIICKLTGMPYVTSLFSCTPGGIAEMGLIAQELGLDTPKIVVMHTCRVIAIICMFPIIMQWFV